MLRQLGKTPQTRVLVQAHTRQQQWGIGRNLRKPGTERLMVIAKAVTEGTEAHLRTVSPGSKIRQAPRDLVRARAHGRTSR